MADKLTTTYTAVRLSSDDEQQRLVQLLDEYLLSLEGGEPITSELLGRHPEVANRHTRSVATDVGVLFLAVVGVFASLVLIADERAAKVEAYRKAEQNYVQVPTQKHDRPNTRSQP